MIEPKDINAKVTLETEMPNRLVFIILCLLSNMSLSQESKEMPVWFPKSSLFVIDLKEVAIAKYNPDLKILQFVRPTYKLTTEVRAVSKTVMNTEKRMKEVNEGGKKSVIPYTVEVPHTIWEEQEYEVQTPLGFEKFEVEISRITARSLAGEAVDPGAMVDKFRKPLYVLATEEAPENFVMPDPFYLSVLNPKIIVVFLPKGTLQHSPGLLDTSKAKKP
jgi:hypothetical protein